MKTTGRLSVKKYRCKECGHEEQHSTNHWGETYSWGTSSTCPKCPPYKRPNTWVCCEEPPEGFGKPEPWNIVSVRKWGKIPFALALIWTGSWFVMGLYRMFPVY